MKKCSRSKRITLASWLTVSLVASVTPSVQAVIVSRGVNQSPGRDSAASRPVVVQSRATPVVTSTQTETRSCSDGNKFPLKALQMLTESGEGIAVSGFNHADGQKKITLSIPEYIKACSEFKFEVIQNPSNGNVGVSVVNDFNFEEYYSQKNWEIPSSFSRMSTYERYEDCLKREGILVNGPNGLEIQRPEYKERNYGTTVSAPIDLDYFDETKPLSVYFGSPKFLGREYGPAYKLRDAEVLGDSCLRVEDIDEEGGVLYSSQEAERARLINICSSGNYDAIRAALNSLGNAHELRSTLESALGKAASDRASEIYERLSEIEDLFKPSREDMADGRSVGVSERQAKALGREYGNLLSELNDIVYTPSMRKLNELIQRREMETNDDKIDEIDEEIKNLNELVGAFNKDHNKESRLGNVYNGLKEYNLQNEAEKIEGFRLKSEYGGRVYEGRNDSRRGKALTIQDADEQIKKKIEYFKETVMKDWDDIYLAKEGNASPVRAAQRRMNSQVARLSTDFQKYQKSEYENYQRYCGRTWYGTVKNPSRCNYFVRGQASRQQRYLRLRERQLNAIKSTNTRLTALDGYYSQAQRAIAAREEQTAVESDPLGIYSGAYFSGDFSDQSDFSNLGGMDPMMSLYGMGPQYQMPMMNQQMMIPNQGAQMPMNNPGAQMISNPLSAY